MSAKQPRVFFVAHMVPLKCHKPQKSAKELVVFGGIASDDASALLSDDGARRFQGSPLDHGNYKGVPLQCHPPSTPTNSHPCVILIAA